MTSQIRALEADLKAAWREYGERSSAADAVVLELHELASSGEVSENSTADGVEIELCELAEGGPGPAARALALMHTYEQHAQAASEATSRVLEVSQAAMRLLGHESQPLA